MGERPPAHPHSSLLRMQESRGAGSLGIPSPSGGRSGWGSVPPHTPTRHSCEGRNPEGRDRWVSLPPWGKVRMGERPPSTSCVTPAKAGIQRGGIAGYPSPLGGRLGWGSVPPPPLASYRRKPVSRGTGRLGHPPFPSIPTAGALRNSARPEPVEGSPLHHQRLSFSHAPRTAQPPTPPHPPVRRLRTPAHAPGTRGQRL